MFGIFKSKDEKQMEDRLMFVRKLQPELHMILGFVPDGSYREFFMVCYGFYDAAFKMTGDISKINNTDFLKLLVTSFSDLLKQRSADINFEKYNQSVKNFIDSYSTAFIDATEKEVELMHMGAKMLMNPNAGQGVMSYFMLKATESIDDDEDFDDDIEF
jgi:uncharacterized protein (UPF0262 family)